MPSKKLEEFSGYKPQSFGRNLIATLKIAKDALLVAGGVIFLIGFLALLVFGAWGAYYIVGELFPGIGKPGIPVRIVD